MSCLRRIANGLSMVTISVAMSIAMSVPVAITMAMVGTSSSLEGSTTITLLFTCLCVPSTIVMSVEAISVSKAVWVVTIGGIEGLRVSLSDGLRSSLGLTCVK